MYLRLPSSSAFCCITAWAVVADPEKKSIITSVFLHDICIICFINFNGLGVSKGISSGNICCISLLASCVWPTSSYVQIDRGTIRSWTSFKKSFIAGEPVPFMPNIIRPSLYIAQNTSSSILQWLPLGGDIKRPVGVFIVYIRPSCLSPLAKIGPNLHGPLGSLSGFLYFSLLFKSLGNRFLIFFHSSPAFE